MLANSKKQQHEAVRIVTGATKLASIINLLSDTGWETLAAKRQKLKQFLLFFNMVKGLVRSANGYITEGKWTNACRIWLSGDKIIYSSILSLEVLMIGV